MSCAKKAFIRAFSSASSIQSTQITARSFNNRLACTMESAGYFLVVHRWSSRG